MARSLSKKVECEKGVFPIFNVMPVVLLGALEAPVSLSGVADLTFQLSWSMRGFLSIGFLCLIAVSDSSTVQSIHLLYSTMFFPFFSLYLSFCSFISCLVTFVCSFIHIMFVCLPIYHTCLSSRLHSGLHHRWLQFCQDIIGRGLG